MCLKRKFRIIAVLLCAVISAATFSACASEEKKIAMTYGQTEITEGMYSYWLSVYKTNFVYTFGGGNDTAEFWKSELEDGVTYADYAEGEIIKLIKYFAVGNELFREYGLKIDRDITDKINADIQEKLDYAGSRPALNSDLSVLGINIDGLKSIYIAEEKWQAVYDYLYGNSGTERVSDDIIEQYYRENYSLLGLIVLNTATKPVTDDDGKYLTDSDGNIKTVALSEDEKALKLQTADEIISSLKSGADFDELAKEYSDSDFSGYKNGVYVSPDNADVYGASLIKKAAEMEIGDIEKIEEEGIIYIAVKRQLINRADMEQSDTEQLSDLTDAATRDIYHAKFDELAGGVIVNDEILAAHPIEKAPMNTQY